MRNPERPEKEIYEPYHPQESYDQEDIDLIYRKIALPSLEKLRPSFSEFKDIYPPQEIQKDEEKVKELQKKFKQRETPEEEKINKIATIFEAVFGEGAEQHNWLGETVIMLPTSLYDDFKNGVDCVAEFQEEIEDKEANETLNKIVWAALNIDVTTSQECWRKFERIKEEIEKGKLAYVKYFRSEHTDYKGILKNIPKVVIAVQPNTVMELAELWAMRKEKGKEAEATHRLETHPIQFQVLEEILFQVRAFASFAEKHQKQEIAQKYREIERIINKIYLNKKSVLRDTQQRDEGFFAIKDLSKGISEE